MHAAEIERERERERERRECIGTEKEIYKLMQKRGEEKDLRPH